MPSKKRKPVIDLNEGSGFETEILVKFKKEETSETDIRVKEEEIFVTNVRAKEEYESFNPQARLEARLQKKLKPFLDENSLPRILVKLNHLVEEFNDMTWVNQSAEIENFDPENSKAVEET